MRTVGLQIKLNGNTAAIAEVKKLKDELRGVSKEIANINKGRISPSAGTSGGSAGKPAAKAASGSTGGTTEAQIKKEIAALQAQGKSYDELAKKAAELRARQQEVTEAIRKQTYEFKAQSFAAGSYKALNSELGKLRDSLRTMSEEERKGDPGKRVLMRVKELDAQLKAIDAEMGQYQRNVGNYASAWDGIGGAIARVGGIFGVALGAREVVNFGLELGRLGAEMEALTAKADVVFGEALPKVDAAARANANSMGLTASQYTNAAAAIGDLLIPMGFQRDAAADVSTQLVNLSGALSEWSGGQKTSAEVTDILSKALLGERESLKSLGISIMESDVQTRIAEKGLKGLTGQALEQAKAMATLELIMEKSTDAQTQYAQGADLAVRKQAEQRAQLQDIKETLATAFLPIWNELLAGQSFFLSLVAEGVKGIVKFIAVLKELPGFLRDNKESLIALGIALIAFNAQSIAASVNALRQAATQRILAISTRAVTAAQWLLNVAMTANPIGAVVAAVALLVGGMIALYKNNELVRKSIDEMTRKFLEWYDSLGVFKILIAQFVEPLRFLFSIIKNGPEAAFKKAKLDFQQFVKTFQEGFNQLVIRAKIFAQQAKGALSLGFIDVAGPIKELEKQLKESQERVKKGAQDTEAQKRQIEDAAAKKKAEKKKEQMKKEQAAEDAALNTRNKELSDKEKQAAEKRAKERLDAAAKILELETKLIVNEYDRREKELKDRAAADITGVGGSPEQRKRQSDLIQQVLKRDLEALNEERRKAGEAALAIVTEYASKFVQAQVAAGKSEIDAVAAAAQRMTDARAKQADIAFAQSGLNLHRQFEQGKIGIDELEFEQSRLQEKYNAAKLERERAAGEERIALRMAQVQQELSVVDNAFRMQLDAITKFQEEQRAALLLQLDQGNLEGDAYFQGVMALDALIAQQRLDAEAEFQRKKNELTEQAAGEALEFQLEMMEKEKSAQQEKNKAIIEFEKQRRQVTEAFEAALGESIGNFLLSQEKDLKGFLKSVTLAALDALERTINIAIAEATARSLASADSVATFGVSGLAKAALIGGLIKGAFAAVKGLIGRLEEGGTIGDGAVWEGSAVPAAGGLISGGRRHAQGGIRGNVSGSPVEIEQGEYYLRNGAYTHVINRSSARRFLPALNALQRAAPATATSPQRANVAMRINRMDAGGTLAVRPLNAPVSPSRVLAAAGAESALGSQGQLEALSVVILEAIAATNRRIDRIMVINDPAETLIMGERELLVRNGKAQ